MSQVGLLRTIASVCMGASINLQAFDVCAQILPLKNEWRQHNVAVLQGLNKVTGRITSFEVMIGHIVSFGTFRIRVDTCQDLPPILPPESAAFLHIEDQLPDEEICDLFTGWMFASSVSLHAVEHPIYSIWLISCRSNFIDD
ncbi:hypothetical protein A1OE_1182 [Candidatus Endolissoclinum faulkneri L2]|uniref:Uncharacterized protein n=1 Tax=Candidatus Endolissoclinum faulkneri L2 TaxID=1193729 RepID=K7YIC7_9PROT|nr:DUF2155 domain-containing protein [Candidatus Endolissoclinum faulkneri]AFX99360.1 hypothetical protein A1OE_1182 [Candidatus Endolissoclinum faulkneri L2]